MKTFLAALLLLLPSLGYSGEDATGLKAGALEVKLNLESKANHEGNLEISGKLLIRNLGSTDLTIQSPNDRQTLAFLVLDSLGNPVAPTGGAKVNQQKPSNLDIKAGATYSHDVRGLEFLTGGALLSYELPADKTFRVVAIYRPAGMAGPGFSTDEVVLNPKP